MKIKDQKQHDNIVNWIISNSETFLTQIGTTDTYNEIKKFKQFEILKGKISVGFIDIRLRYTRIEDFKNYDYHNESKNNPVETVTVNVFVNVKMESATEQLRETKKILRQYNEIYKPNPQTKNYFVIVSENDQYKSFFTDEGFLFYKFGE